MLGFYIGKCTCIVKFSFLALVAFCCIYSGVGIGFSCFLATLLHEGSHLLTMQFFGVLPEKAELSIMGCRVEIGGYSQLNDKQQSLISLAGPCGNLLTALFVWTVGNYNSFVGVNLAMCIAHSLPIEPLDGGLALHYILRSHFRKDKAEIISRVISSLLLLPLSVLGYYLLLQTKYNFSLLALNLYLTAYLLFGKDYSQP